jgi:hypothetical protein
MPPKGRRKQVFKGEEIKSNITSEDTQYTPIYPPVEEIEYTLIRTGALRRTPLTTAIYSGKEP